MTSLGRLAIIGTRGYPSYYGGFETAVREVSPYLAKAGWDVTVYGRPNSVRKNDPTADAAVHSVETRGLEYKSLSTLSYGLSASLHAFRSRFDVALIMNVANGYFLPLLKAAGIHTVVNVDGIEWERAKWGRVARSTFKTGARLTAKYADELIVDSLAIGSYWEETFGRSGSFIPYGGHEHPPLPFTEQFSGREYVLVVARFVPENSIPEFIEAARQIAEYYDVVIVGSSGYGGALDASVHSLASELPRVHALGHISDDSRLHALWQNAALYFHGHSVGGTNPTLVQAMALHVPILARDTVFNREVLGSTGAFVEADPDQIASVALSLLRDPARRRILADDALQIARARYSWESVCQAYEQTLSNQMNGRR